MVTGTRPQSRQFTVTTAETSGRLTSNLKSRALHARRIKCLSRSPTRSVPQVRASCCCAEGKKKDEESVERS